MGSTCNVRVPFAVLLFSNPNKSDMVCDEYLKWRGIFNCTVCKWYNLHFRRTLKVFGQYTQNLRLLCRHIRTFPK